MSNRKKEVDFWSKYFGPTVLEVPAATFVQALASYLPRLERFPHGIVNDTDGESFLRRSLTLLFNPGRLFVRRIESSFFFTKVIAQADFWRILANPIEIEKLSAKIKELEEISLIRSDSIDSNWGVSYSLIDEQTGAEVSVLTLCTFKNTNRHEGYFVGHLDPASYQQKNRLRFFIFRNQLHIQDLSINDAVRIRVTGRTKISVNKGLYMGLGANAQHRFRVVKVFPLPANPELKDPWTATINAWNTDKKFLKAVKTNEITDLFELNAFHFSNKRHDFKSQKPKVVIEFTSGQYKGRRMEFEAPQGSLCAKKAVIEFVFGMSDSANVPFNDHEMSSQALRLVFDPSVGWLFLPSASPQKDGKCSAFAFLKEHDMVNNGSLAESSFFQLVSSNLFMHFNGKNMLLKKTIMYSGSVIE
jgi:hypothetical protein